MNRFLIFKVLLLFFFVGREFWKFGRVEMVFVNELSAFKILNVYIFSFMNI